MVFKLSPRMTTFTAPFENDVNMYGIQTKSSPDAAARLFENDVNMYGIQTGDNVLLFNGSFENDVNMYGIQTFRATYKTIIMF